MHSDLCFPREAKMLLATALGLHSLEVMGVTSEWDLLRTMSSVLCVVLREGIPGQVREQSAYGHPSPPPHRATLRLSLLRAIASLGYDHYYRNSALFLSLVSVHTTLITSHLVAYKNPNYFFREDVCYSHL